MKFTSQAVQMPNGTKTYIMRFLCGPTRFCWHGGYCQTNVCTKQFSILRVFFLCLLSILNTLVGVLIFPELCTSRVLYAEMKNIKKSKFYKIFLCVPTVRQRKEGKATVIKIDVYHSHMMFIITVFFCVFLLVYTTDFVHFHTMTWRFPACYSETRKFQIQKRDHR